MIRLGAILTCLLWVAACGQRPVGPAVEVDRLYRLDAIREGLALRSESPEAAAEVLCRAGVGPELERLRFEVWLDSLERGQVAPEAWAEFFSQRPPQDLEDRGRLIFSRFLVSAGRLEEASKLLEGESQNRKTGADGVRLSWPESGIRRDAALRLAVTAPEVLRREKPSLEPLAVAALNVRDRVARGAAWREAGYPSRGAAELRSIRAGGSLERRRRLELARCELRRGSVSAALAVLPALSRCDRDEALERASCWRRRGWSRFPGQSAAEAFDNCLTAARRAVSLSTGQSSLALELQLECGTEAARFEPALAAWEALSELNWSDSRKGWLGRRLGIALARSGHNGQAIENLTSSLGNHSRCLQFASATQDSKIDGEVVARLAEVAIPDLYGLWSLDEIGEKGPSALGLPLPISVGDPPPTVAWLIDLGERTLASEEWRRLVDQRGASPAEALAAALFEDGRGRPDLAIRGLRRVFTDLGGPGMERVPENVVKVYLPLRWTSDVKNAADEFGLSPWLLAGLARQESIFNSRARSPAGARGVVQLMPGTARGHAVALGLGRKPDLFDPAINLRLGARELSRLIGVFGEIEPAVAAYNAGESRVRRWWKRWPERRQFTESVPIPETYNYIRRVMFLSEAYRLVWADQWVEDVE